MEERVRRWTISSFKKNKQTKKQHKKADEQNKSVKYFFHIELSVLCSTAPRERTTVVQVLSVRPHHSGALIYLQALGQA